MRACEVCGAADLDGAGAAEHVARAARSEARRERDAAAARSEEKRQRIRDARAAAKRRAAQRFAGGSIDA